MRSGPVARRKLITFRRGMTIVVFEPALRTLLTRSAASPAVTLTMLPVGDGSAGADYPRVRPAAKTLAAPARSKGTIAHVT